MNMPAVRENPSYMRNEVEYDPNEQYNKSANHNSNPYYYSERKPIQNNYLENYNEAQSYENSPEKSDHASKRSKHYYTRKLRY